MVIEIRVSSKWGGTWKKVQDAWHCFYTRKAGVPGAMTYGMHSTHNCQTHYVIISACALHYI